MIYDGTFGGMNIFWWFLWGFLMVWIFAVPYDIPGQRNKKQSPLDILKRRFASGQILNDEYLEKKKILELDIVK